jgi:hypothetical protein
MRNLRKLLIVASTIVTGTLIGSTTALAQSVQVLDTVEVFCADCVLEMKFDDPERTDDDFELRLEQSGANFIACMRDPGNGFFCLDKTDKFVKKWADLGGPAENFIDCEDPVLGLDARKADTCTGLAVGLDATWIAGKNKGKSFSLLKVTECELGKLLPISSPGLCAEELYTGRPLLVDIKPVQNETADNFLTLGPGILGLEQRTDLSFFKDLAPGVASPVLIAGKKTWGLSGRERLQSVGLLQINNPMTGELDNYALATSNNDRILACKVESEAEGCSTAVEVINIASDDEDLAGFRVPLNECNADEQHYGLSISGKSSTVYFTDKNYCLSVALQATDFDGSGNLVEMAVAEDSAGKLILSTSGEAGNFPPAGPTTSPGIGIDLAGCADNCTLIAGTGAPAAFLEDVQLVDNGNSGATLFQIKGLPHCAWIPKICYEILTGNSTTDRDVALDYLIYNPMGEPGESVDVLRELDLAVPDRPAEALVYNVTPMLPKEVIDASGDLPPLLLPAEYRAQEMNGFFFEALFFVAQPGIQFQDTFTLELDVAKLTEVPPSEILGCTLDLPNGTTASEMLLWDVTVRASERYKSINDQFQGTMVNFGCGSVRTRGGGISIFPYNFELTPCPVTRNSAGAWATDCGLPPYQSETVDDAVFAKLYVTLYDELRAHLNQLACTTVDGGAAPPIDASLCGQLDANWLNGKDKLVKALDATISPKDSSGSQNLGAVASQLQNYRSQLPGPNVDDDPANRIGEQKARLDTLEHVLNDRFLPSIPATGFDEVDRTWADF